METNALLQKIENLNTGNHSEFFPFLIEGCQVGRIHRDNICHLDANLFVVTSDSVSLHPSLDTPEKRTEKIQEFNVKLKEKGVIKQWRGEYYAVAQIFGGKEFMRMERSSAKFYGFMCYGLHLNGFVVKDGQPMMWIAKRSLSKPTYPGLYDNVVAGGYTAGLSPTELLVKECDEEAKIPAELAKNALPTSVVSYVRQEGSGTAASTIFIYDLQLPLDFQPVANDGEVDSFHLMPYDEVLNLIKTTDSFKDNVNAVIIDFFVRHGVITPEEPGYIDIIKALRQ